MCFIINYKEHSYKNSKQMIYIQSDSQDSSTNDVLDWLLFYNTTFSRLNSENGIQKFHYSILDNEMNINNQIFCDNSYWYRRGSHYFITKSNNESTFIKNYKNNIEFEISSFFKQSKAIGSSIDNDSSKIQQIRLANNCNLNIPDTIISNDTNKIQKFIDKNKKIACKPIKDAHKNFEFYLKDTMILLHQKNEFFINEFNLSHTTTCLPALFQEYIPKRYELRIFYLKGEFYSMAIFSQENEKTKLDFRNYDEEKPNRNVPYVLPKEIEEKLNNLMIAMDVNCGSIDMIYTPEGEYVFLEVNPVGQYQWLERNCNYPISKRIAETLSYKENI